VGATVSEVGGGWSHAIRAATCRTWRNIRAKLEASVNPTGGQPRRGITCARRGDVFAAFLESSRADPFPGEMPSAARFGELAHRYVVLSGDAAAEVRFTQVGADVFHDPHDQRCVQRLLTNSTASVRGDHRAQ
jgi:hypothetical protein